jgi:hypothetical protein
MGWALAIVGALAIIAAAVVGRFLWDVLFPPDWVERYPSGAVKARGPLYHGDRQEHWTFYYESGEKESEGEYVAGFKSGEWSFWHRNGRLRARGQLDDGGYKAGEWVYGDELGRPLSEAEFFALYPSDSLHQWPLRRADQANQPGAVSAPARDLG